MHPSLSGKGALSAMITDQQGQGQPQPQFGIRAHVRTVISITTGPRRRAFRHGIPRHPGPRKAVHHKVRTARQRNFSGISKYTFCLTGYIIYPEIFKVLPTLMYLGSVAAESKVGLLFKGLRLFGDLVCRFILAPRARYAEVIVPTPETAPRPSQKPFHHHTATTKQSNSIAGLA